MTRLFLTNTAARVPSTGGTSDSDGKRVRYRTSPRAILVVSSVAGFLLLSMRFLATPLQCGDVTQRRNSHVSLSELTDSGYKTQIVNATLLKYAPFIVDW